MRVSTQQANKLPGSTYWSKLYNVQRVIKDGAGGTERHAMLREHSHLFVFHLGVDCHRVRVPCTRACK